MAIKTILTEPNKILRQISKPVVSVGKEEQSLMKDMLETMYHAKGIGLAAIQVGVPKRIIVLDISKEENKKRSSSRKVTAKNISPKAKVLAAEPPKIKLLLCSDIVMFCASISSLCSSINQAKIVTRGRPRKSNSKSVWLIHNGALKVGRTISSICLINQATTL